MRVLKRTGWPARVLTFLGVALVVAGVAVAASYFLFQHTLPGTTLPAPQLVVSSACAGALPAAGYVGSTTTSAWAVFSCSGEAVALQSTPAITLKNVGNATAAFTQPSGVADVWLVGNGVAVVTGCAQAGTSNAQVPGFNLTANPVVEVTSALVSNQYNYCVDGTPGATFASFTISWSQQVS